MSLQRLLLVDGLPVGRVRLLTGFWERQRGLLATSASAGPAWLTPCRSVHTWGMTYPLDVALVSAQDQVLAVRRLEPWRGPTRPAPGTVSVLEAPAGAFDRWPLRPGSQLSTGPLSDAPPVAR